VSASRNRRVVTAALVAGACVALALTGCSSGQLTQTASQVSAVAGTQITVGSLALRDLKVVYNGPDGYRAGESAPLEIRIFNNGTTPITLTEVRAEQAEAVTLTGGPGGNVSPAPATSEPAATPSPATSPSPVASPSPSPAASPSPEASPSPGAASPSPSPSPAPPTPSRLSIQIPPGSYVLLVPTQGSFLQLTGLKEPLVPGEWVDLVFTFDNGASVPIQVPLVAPPGITVPRATPVVPGGEEGH